MTTNTPQVSVDNPAKTHSPSDTSEEVIFTPVGSNSPVPVSQLPSQSTRRPSPSPLRLSAIPTRVAATDTEELDERKYNLQRKRSDSDIELDELDDEMASTRHSMHRPMDNKSNQPLLKDEDRGRQSYESSHGIARPAFGQRALSFRSRSPSYGEPRNATTKTYTYSAFFLLLSLIAFVVQTETAFYIQHTLNWKKPYCMLYLTHGSWSLLWPFQLLVLRIQKHKMSWPAFWRRHKYILRTTAQMVRTQELHLTASTEHISPIPYMVKTIAFITTALTVAGGSWYVAVDLTTPSDLTAIYNCSAFFAYVFSIVLLNDKLRFDKIFSVAVAIAGVLIVAYGDQSPTKHGGQHGGVAGGKGDAEENVEASSRAIGNLIIGVGSVLYGLYEVLYKKLACPPEGTSPGRGMIFANTVGSMIGLFTLCVLWIPLPILHYSGLEPFELPRGRAAGLLAISTLSNAIFSGSFLVLMSLTSPVLSSVAALLTIFLVAITDWLRTDKPLSSAAIMGGCAIILAFALLSWATYREMDEERKKRAAEEGVDVEADDEV